MKKIVALLMVCILFLSCRDKGIPDVSSIRVNLQVNRFEKDFFSIDTNNIRGALQQLYAKYADFLTDYSQHILGLPPLTDTSVSVFIAIKKFLTDYKPIKDSVDKLFKGTTEMENGIISGLQFVKYYFPSYKLPGKLITFIGPIDAYFEGSLSGYGDVITTEGLAVGLQLHLGSNFSYYKSEMGQGLYPAYISRRFAPEYIPVNCIKNVIDDLFPDNSTGKTLVEQMVERGKRLYLLDKFMPRTPDSLKIGYTDNQLKGCMKNEGLIWNYFLTNSLLYNNDPAMIKSYISDAPNTAEFGEGSPGYIALFTGWQIVKKYMNKNSSLSLLNLMQADAKRIFEESKYRPR